MSNQIGDRERLAAQRRAPADIALKQETTRWLSGLPVNLLPRSLIQEMPRIANALCRFWPVPTTCLAYFDELLIDRRGNRRGFPMGIAMELANLKNYYETKVHPAPQTWWDHLAV